MKKYLLIIISCFTNICVHASGVNIDSLLNILDEVIVNRDSYTASYTEKIDRFRAKLQEPGVSPEKSYELNDVMFELYRPFISDSAVVYITRNVDIARDMKWKEKEIHSLLKYARHLSSCGLFHEATYIIEQVDRPCIEDNDLLFQYYIACEQVYGEAGYYAKDPNLNKKLCKIGYLYLDSIHTIHHKQDDDLLCKKEIWLRNNNQLTEALQINNIRQSLTHKDSPTYAIILYYRSLIYQQMQDSDQYIACLIRSAIADMKNATKDHASLWMLAEALLNQGDIERAYHYMNISWKDTKFFNARLRAWQSSDKLSLIDNTYQMLLKQSNRMLRISTVIASLLSLIAILFLILLYKQKKKLTIARKGLIETNKQLTVLNQELKDMNLAVQVSNEKLNESNHIKDEYILRFTKLCSTYIDKLDELRHLASKMITTHKTQELLKLTRSDALLEGPLRDLYANFDSSFLKLFPTFVEQFNELLAEDGKIVPKVSGELNTELRIFALIRLGIVDSSQIAEFLRYSVNTIYNYRGKVKNKAIVPRDEFESRVCKIK